MHVTVTMYNQSHINSNTCYHVTFPSTYSDTTKIGLLQMSEDHIQKCTVVVGEII